MIFGNRTYIKLMIMNKLNSQTFTKTKLNQDSGVAEVKSLHQTQLPLLSSKWIFLFLIFLRTGFNFKLFLGACPQTPLADCSLSYSLDYSSHCLPSQK